MKNIKIAFFLGLLGFALYSFKTLVQDEWVVPEKYKTMKNPTDPNDNKKLAIGRNLYAQHCQACHGKQGFGDGPKAANQKGDMGDFSSDATQSLTDGALFYKITTGRGDMANFDKKLPRDEDRWLLVNYLRTLKE
tara:strand:- start:1557 stop:1961 length:405 start_codon:yes stop_codon:yes gene_type:complete